MSGAGAPAPRPAAALRAVWGAALVLVPHAVLAAVTRGRPAAPAVAGPILRVLGLRQPAQAILQTRRPTAAVFALGAVTDALHASSAPALAAADRWWRRTGAMDAVLAAGFGLAAARQARVRSSAGPPAQADPIADHLSTSHGADQ